MAQADNGFDYIDFLARGREIPITFDPPDDSEVLTIQPIADSVLESIRRRAPSDLTELLVPERVLVRTMPHAKVQAMTIWADPVHVIVVNTGLMLFVYRVARAIAPYMIVRGPQDPPPPPEGDTVGIITQLVDWLSSPVNAPLSEGWQTGPREIRTAENIVTASERFVVSHEIAHIMYRHLIVDASLVDVESVPAERLYERNVGHEIEADIVGAFLTVESMPDIGIDPRAGGVGVIFFLHCLLLAEAVGAVVSGGTHPPVVERIAAVTGGMEMRFGADAPMLLAPAAEYSEVLTHYAMRVLAERQRRRDMAASFMDKVFREAAPSDGSGDGQRRDHALLESVEEMLWKAPSAVLEAIIANLMSTEEYRAAMSPASSTDSERLRRHKLAHFLGRYLPPNVRPAIGIHSLTFYTERS